MKLIALCGMPGSGKSTVRSYVEDVLGVPAWYVGQPLLDECIRAGLEPTYANRMEMGSRLGLFDASDPLRFIKSSVEKMKARHPDAGAICFDSVRSLNELQFLHSTGMQVAVVAVILERAERFRRLLGRDRLGLDDFEIRDRMEIGLSDPYRRKLGVGRLIALADHYILSPAGIRTTSLAFQVKGVLTRLGVGRPNGRSSHVANRNCRELRIL